MNLKLKLIYKSGGKTFKELNFSKDYVVNTQSEAAGLLINDFSFSDADLNDFFNEGSKKMKKFYSENCNSVVESAKKYQSIGEPEKALAICLSIPTDVPCYNSIANLNKEVGDAPRVVDKAVESNRPAVTAELLSIVGKVMAQTNRNMVVSSGN